MAIQVGGTQVISNTQGLTNIASVDATTAASISAAGVGGGGTYDFVASGAISAGDVVALNTAGTGSVVSSSNIANWVGIATAAISSGATGTITIFTGTNDQQSGLTAGTVYYANTSGGLSTSGTYKVGKAISATEILIEEGNA